MSSLAKGIAVTAVGSATVGGIAYAVGYDTLASNWVWAFEAASGAGWLTVVPVALTAYGTFWLYQHMKKRGQIQFTDTDEKEAILWLQTYGPRLLTRASDGAGSINRAGFLQATDFFEGAGKPHHEPVLAWVIEALEASQMVQAKLPLAGVFMYHWMNLDALTVEETKHANFKPMITAVVKLLWSSHIRTFLVPMLRGFLDHASYSNRFPSEADGDKLWNELRYQPYRWVLRLSPVHPWTMEALCYVPNTNVKLPFRQAVVVQRVNLLNFYFLYEAKRITVEHTITSLSVSLQLALADLMKDSMPYLASVDSKVEAEGPSEMQRDPTMQALFKSWSATPRFVVLDGVLQRPQGGKLFTPSRIGSFSLAFLPHFVASTLNARAISGYNGEGGFPAEKLIIPQISKFVNFELPLAQQDGKVMKTQDLFLAWWHQIQLPYLQASSQDRHRCSMPGLYPVKTLVGDDGCTEDPHWMVHNIPEASADTHTSYKSTYYGYILQNYGAPLYNDCFWSWCDDKFYQPMGNDTLLSAATWKNLWWLSRWLPAVPTDNEAYWSLIVAILECPFILPFYEERHTEARRRMTTPEAHDRPIVRLSTNLRGALEIIVPLRPGVPTSERQILWAELVQQWVRGSAITENKLITYNSATFSSAAATGPTQRHEFMVGVHYIILRLIFQKIRYEGVGVVPRFHFRVARDLYDACAAHRYSSRYHNNSRHGTLLSNVTALRIQAAHAVALGMYNAVAAVDQENIGARKFWTIWALMPLVYTFTPPIAAADIPWFAEALSVMLEHVCVVAVTEAFQFGLQYYAMAVSGGAPFKPGHTPTWAAADGRTGAEHLWYQMLQGAISTNNELKLANNYEFSPHQFRFSPFPITTPLPRWLEEPSWFGTMKPLMTAASYGNWRSLFPRLEHEPHFWSQRAMTDSNVKLSWQSHCVGRGPQLRRQIRQDNLQETIVPQCQTFPNPDRTVDTFLSQGALWDSHYLSSKLGVTTNPQLAELSHHWSAMVKAWITCPGSYYTRDGCRVVQDRHAGPSLDCNYITSRNLTLLAQWMGPDVMLKTRSVVKLGIFRDICSLAQDASWALFVNRFHADALAYDHPGFLVVSLDLSQVQYFRAVFYETRSFAQRTVYHVEYDSVSQFRSRFHPHFPFALALRMYLWAKYRYQVLYHTRNLELQNLLSQVAQGAYPLPAALEVRSWDSQLRLWGQKLAAQVPDTLALRQLLVLVRLFVSPSVEVWREQNMASKVLHDPKVWREQNVASQVLHDTKPTVPYKLPEEGQSGWLAKIWSKFWSSKKKEDWKVPLFNTPVIQLDSQALLEQEPEFPSSVHVGVSLGQRLVRLLGEETSLGRRLVREFDSQAVFVDTVTALDDDAKAVIPRWLVPGGDPWATQHAFTERFSVEPVANNPSYLALVAWMELSAFDYHLLRENVTMVIERLRWWYSPGKTAEPEEKGTYGTRWYSRTKEFKQIHALLGNMEDLTRAGPSELASLVPYFTNARLQERLVNELWGANTTLIRTQLWKFALAAMEYQGRLARTQAMKENRVQQLSTSSRLVAQTSAVAPPVVAFQASGAAASMEEKSYWDEACRGQAQAGWAAVRPSPEGPRRFCAGTGWMQQDADEAERQFMTSNPDALWQAITRSSWQSWHSSPMERLLLWKWVSPLTVESAQEIAAAVHSMDPAEAFETRHRALMDRSLAYRRWWALESLLLSNFLFPFPTEEQRPVLTSLLNTYKHRALITLDTSTPGTFQLRRSGYSPLRVSVDDVLEFFAAEGAQPVSFPVALMIYAYEKTQGGLLVLNISYRIARAGRNFSQRYAGVQFASKIPKDRMTQVKKGDSGPTYRVMAGVSTYREEAVQQLLNLYRQEAVALIRTHAHAHAPAASRPRQVRKKATSVVHAARPHPGHPAVHSGQHTAHPAVRLGQHMVHATAHTVSHAAKTAVHKAAHPSQHVTKSAAHARAPPVSSLAKLVQKHEEEARALFRKMPVMTAGTAVRAVMKDAVVARCGGFTQEHLSFLREYYQREHPSVPPNQISRMTLQELCRDLLGNPALDYVDYRPQVHELDGVPVSLTDQKTGMLDYQSPEKREAVDDWLRSRYMITLPEFERVQESMSDEARHQRYLDRRRRQEELKLEAENLRRQRTKARTYQLAPCRERTDCTSGPNHTDLCWRPGPQQECKLNLEVHAHQLLMGLSSLLQHQNAHSALELQWLDEVATLWLGPAAPGHPWPMAAELWDKLHARWVDWGRDMKDHHTLAQVSTYQQVRWSRHFQDGLALCTEASFRSLLKAMGQPQGHELEHLRMLYTLHLSVKYRILFPLHFFNESNETLVRAATDK